MSPGSRLVVLGLGVVFLAMIFEFLSWELSGLAVGFGLVLVGLLLLVSRAVVGERSTGRVSCDDCGSSNDSGATECSHCGKTL